MLERVRNIVLPPPAVLLVLLALATFAASGETRSSDRALNTKPDDAQASTDVAMSTIGLQLKAPDPTVRQDIAQNSLFLERRAPWENPAEEPASQPVVVIESAAPREVQPEPIEALTPPNVALIGVIQAEGVTRALVFDNDTQTEHWLQIGELHREWEITSITTESIVLRAMGEEMVVFYNR